MFKPKVNRDFNMSKPVGHITDTDEKKGINPNRSIISSVKTSTVSGRRRNMMWLETDMKHVDIGDIKLRYGKDIYSIFEMEPEFQFTSFNSIKEDLAKIDDIDAEVSSSDIYRSKVHFSIFEPKSILWMTLLPYKTYVIARPLFDLSVKKLYEENDFDFVMERNAKFSILPINVFLNDPNSKFSITIGDVPLVEVKSYETELYNLPLTQYLVDGVIIHANLTLEMDIMLIQMKVGYNDLKMKPITPVKANNPNIKINVKMGGVLITNQCIVNGNVVDDIIINKEYLKLTVNNPPLAMIYNPNSYKVVLGSMLIGKCPHGKLKLFGGYKQKRLDEISNTVMAIPQVRCPSTNKVITMPMHEGFMEMDARDECGFCYFHGLPPSFRTSVMSYLQVDMSPMYYDRLVSAGINSIDTDFNVVSDMLSKMALHMVPKPEVHMDYTSKKDKVIVMAPNPNNMITDIKYDDSTTTPYQFSIDSPVPYSTSRKDEKMEEVENRNNVISNNIASLIRPKRKPRTQERRVAINRDMINQEVKSLNNSLMLEELTAASRIEVKGKISLPESCRVNPTNSKDMGPIKDGVYTTSSIYTGTLAIVDNSNVYGKRSNYTTVPVYTTVYSAQ